MTRIAIIDDEALVRAGLRMILESADDLQVVGEGSDGKGAVELIERCRPDLLLMDIRMPDTDGLTATRAIQLLDHPPPIVILTTFDLDDYVFQALQAGASGFLLKDTPPLDLINAIRVVAAGDSMLSPSVTRRLIAHFAEARPTRQSQARSRLLELSPRELEVVTELARGLSNSEIGAALFISEATVKAHVSHLLVKLGVNNRVQVAILAHDAQLD